MLLKLAELVPQSKDTHKVLCVLVGGKMLLQQDAELLPSLETTKAKTLPASPGFSHRDDGTVFQYEVVAP